MSRAMRLATIIATSRPTHRAHGFIIRVLGRRGSGDIARSAVHAQAETYPPDETENRSWFNCLRALPLWFLQLDSLPTDSGSILLPCSGSVVALSGNGPPLSRYI